MMENDRSHCSVQKSCIISSQCNFGNKDQKSYFRKWDEYNQGALIWCDRDEDCCGFVIRKGIVALLRYLPDGTENIFEILGEGQAFGQNLLFSHDECFFIARACTQVELCKFSISELEELVRSDAQVAERVIRSLTCDLQWIIQGVEIRGNICVRERVQKSLQQLTAKLDDGSGEVELPLTHDDVANLVGINRVTATRELNRLKNEGIVKLGIRKIRMINHQTNDSQSLV